MKRRVLAIAAAVLALASPALTQPASATNRADEPGKGERRVVDIEQRTVGIEHRTVGIVRRVTSISGDIKTEEGPKSVEVTLAADVLFAFDQAELTPAASKRIDEVAKKLKSAKGPAAIVGYTDAKGTDAYNADLSLKRATAVRDALAAKAPSASFTVAGKGASDPVAPNTNEDSSDNPDGRALNRRVTITFDRSA